MEKKEKCVVAGGGPAGLEVAAILSKQKPELRPIVFEKDAEVGGRAKSFWIDGYWLEIGQHYAGTLGDNEIARGLPAPHHHIKCAELADANVTYERCDLSVAYMHPAFPGEAVSLSRVTPANPEFDKELTKTVFPYLDDATISELENLYQATYEEMATSEEMQEVFRCGHDIQKGPKETVDAWLRRHNASKLAVRYMKEIIGTNLAIPVEDCGKPCMLMPVGTMIVGLRDDWFRYTYPVSPKPPIYGGWAAEPLAYRDAILRNGGRIYVGTRVKKIVIAKGKVRGVVVEHEGKEVTIETDLAITDIPPGQALASGVLDEKEMDVDWVQGVKSAQKAEEEMYNTGYVMANFCLKKALTTTQAWVMVLDEEGRMVGGIDASRNPDTAPPGKQVISFMRWIKLGQSGEKEKMNMRLAQEVVDEYLLPHMRVHWKDFDDMVEYCLIHFHPNVWDQALTYSAPHIYLGPIDVPGVEGLYYVGNWASGAGGTLTLKCTHSAILCAEMILGKELQ